SPKTRKRIKNGAMERYAGKYLRHLPTRVSALRSKLLFSPTPTWVTLLMCLTSLYIQPETSLKGLASLIWLQGSPLYFIDKADQPPKGAWSASPSRLFWPAGYWSVNSLCDSA